MATDRNQHYIPLTVSDHRRDILGMTYVYPVVSRRAGGVSVGINLNPNNACNWRCIYCQVPELVRGNAPLLDLAQLRAELAQMLEAIVHGDFLAHSAPPEAQRLNDIALSGNGEPTSSRQFGAVLEVIESALQEFDLLGKIKTVLITNGSQCYKAPVLEGIAHLRKLNGEVWFKIDRAPEAGYSYVNQIAINEAQIQRHLLAAASRCPTWVQTCMFAVDGILPDEAALQRYLQLLQDALAAGTPLAGVLLYGIARPSTQPEAARLSSPPLAWMEKLAEQIRALGLTVKLSA